jgi:site-specific DNA-methyltransferase (adenine-specific)
MTGIDMKTTHKIISGDARVMDLIDDESLHLIITSPPYWQLKDYGDNRQLGYHDSYENYINNLNLVWQESFRVLKSSCRMCINIGDQFARSVYYGRYKVIPIRTEIIKFCETIGFDYMGAIIWQKVTTTNTTGGAAVMGSYPYPRNGILKLDYEFILVFKKPGPSLKSTKENKELSKLSPAEWNSYFSGHWTFPGEKKSEHLAPFPIELPNRLIKMFSFVNDTILDPFLGSGTTLISAKNHHRNSIGIEINDQFIPIINKKLKKSESENPAEYKLEFLKQKLKIENFENRIRELPYIFNDPHMFDKKIEPPELTFGSKINAATNNEKNYYSVKKVLGPDRIQLNNGNIVNLIGIEIKPDKEQEAIAYLTQKTRSQKLVVTYDKKISNKNGRHFVYLYLKNKTFLNAHLIKRGLAAADTVGDYKYCKMFKKYEEIAVKSNHL